MGVEGAEDTPKSPPDRVHVSDAWQGCDLVFCTKAGRPLIARNLVRSFVALLDKAAVPQIRAHALRHTATTLLLSARVNLQVVSEMLGHSHVSVTLSIYSHVLPHMQQQAANAMDEALGRSSCAIVRDDKIAQILTVCCQYRIVEPCENFHSPKIR